MLRRSNTSHRGLDHHPPPIARWEGVGGSGSGVGWGGVTAASLIRAWDTGRGMETDGFVFEQ